MLGIDAIVTFAEADFSGVADLTAYDAVIGMPRHADGQPDFPRNELFKGLITISIRLTGNTTNLLNNCQHSRAIGSNDIMALSQAMLAVRRSDINLTAIT